MARPSLLGLPLELRLLIYKFLFEGSRAALILADYPSIVEKKSLQSRAAILQVCTQIRREAFPFFNRAFVIIDEIEFMGQIYYPPRIARGVEKVQTDRHFYHLDNVARLLPQINNITLNFRGNRIPDTHRVFSTNQLAKLLCGSFDLGIVRGIHNVATKEKEFREAYTREPSSPKTVLERVDEGSIKLELLYAAKIEVLCICKPEELSDSEDSSELEEPEADMRSEWPSILEILLNDVYRLVVDFKDIEKVRREINIGTDGNNWYEEQKWIPAENVLHLQYDSDSAVLYVPDTGESRIIWHSSATVCTPFAEAPHYVSQLKVFQDVMNMQLKDEEFLKKALSTAIRCEKQKQPQRKD